LSACSLCSALGFSSSKRRAKDAAVLKFLSFTALGAAQKKKQNFSRRQGTCIIIVGEQRKHSQILNPKQPNKAKLQQKKNQNFSRISKVAAEKKSKVAAEKLQQNSRKKRDTCMHILRPAHG
jgi:hypothetical protein